MSILLDKHLREVPEQGGMPRDLGTIAYIAEPAILMIAYDRVRVICVLHGECVPDMVTLALVCW